jgi:hypothetical protein
MDNLVNLQLNKVLAYPVIEPPIKFLFSSLLIWETIELIWGENEIQVQKFRDEAEKSTIFFDKGLVSLKQPFNDEIVRASEELIKLRSGYLEEIKDDDAFSDRFIINPVKVTKSYWESARKRQDEFLDVPQEVGRLYLGLLAMEMSKRPNDSVPILTTRIHEPLFLEGGIRKKPSNLDPDECIVQASFNCLVPSEDLREMNFDDIISIRKLESWYNWREELLSYKKKLNRSNSIKEVNAITHELNYKASIFKKDIDRNKWIIASKIGLTIVGGVVGFFVGSLPGAITGASVGAATTGIDIYQAHSGRNGRRQQYQQFTIDAKKIFDKYNIW